MKNIRTDNMTVYYDCIYAYKKITDRSETLLPYCRRDERSKSISKTKCKEHGMLLTFSQMQDDLITAQDLFDWYAPIDTIDAYAKYLFLNERSSENYVFCNCSWPWFGVHCEYFVGQVELHSAAVFMTLVELQRKNHLRSSRTCYIDLNCKIITGIFCLDWRQICNGIRDCIDGEDETNCQVLEMTICRDDQFRCSNGLCIDRAFLDDLSYDCLDRSDEHGTFAKPEMACHEYPSFEYEEHNCAWMKTTCGDGRCIKSPLGECCTNNMFLFRQRWFQRDATLPVNCSIALICSFRKDDYALEDGLDRYGCSMHFYRTAISFDYQQQIASWCPEIFSFPSTYQLSPPVRLVYKNSGGWKSTQPDYLCYETSDACPLYPSTTSTMINNVTFLYCRAFADYRYEHVYPYSYDGFIADLQRILSHCFDERICTTGNTPSVECNVSLQCISSFRHRGENTLFLVYKDTL